jgi:hypothetical protein
VGIIAHYSGTIIAQALCAWPHVSVSQSLLEKEFALDFFFFSLLPFASNYPYPLLSAFSFPVFICPVSVLGKYNGKGKKEKSMSNFFTLSMVVTTLLPPLLLSAVQFGMALCPISSVLNVGM